MISTLWILLPWLTGAFGVAGLYAVVSDFYIRNWSRVNERVDAEFRKRRDERQRTVPLFKNAEQRSTDVLGLAETATLDAGKAGPWQQFEAMVRQSGLNLSPSRFCLIALGAGLLLGAVGGILRGPLFALMGISVGVAGPLLFVHAKRKARWQMFLEQLPDAFELMAQVLRAGHSVPQAMQAAAEEFEPPIAAEFNSCYEQQNLGLSPEVVLRDLARRTGLLEIKIFVMAMLIQRETGGNVAELLERLAAFVRDRLRIQGAIRSLTAEARLQALVLLVLPGLLFVILLVINRSYAQLLLDHVNVLIGMLISMAVGALWIRRIITIDV
jgi:tight adherence protein B